MEPTVRMIMDRLDGMCRLAGSEEAAARPLRGVRMLGGGQSGANSLFLYVGSAGDVIHAASESPAVCFAAAGVTEEGALAGTGSCALLFPEFDDTSVLEAVQAVWEEFSRWELDALHAVLSRRPLREILEIGSRMLDNPVAMLDRTNTLVAWAGQIEGDILGTAWEPLFDKGYSPVETLSVSQRRIVDSRNREGIPYIYHARLPAHEEDWLLCGLSPNGSFFGTVASVDLKKPFSGGQCDVTGYVKHFLEMALENSGSGAGRNDDLYFVRRLLTGQEIAASTVEYHLGLLGWKEPRTFHVCLIANRREETLPGESWEKYLLELKRVDPGALILPFEKGILMISRRLEGDGIRDLTRYLDRVGMAAGISMRQVSFMNLRYAYEQSRAAWELGEDRTLNRFENSYAAYLIKSLGRTADLKVLCHPAVLRFASLDGKRGKEYILCLKTYLAFGQNTAATAKALHIHRNTLLYRLDRISSELGMRLDSCPEQILFILQLSCLLAEYAAGEDM